MRSTRRSDSVGRTSPQPRRCTMRYLSLPDPAIRPGGGAGVGQTRGSQEARNARDNAYWRIRNPWKSSVSGGLAARQHCCGPGCRGFESPRSPHRLYRLTCGFCRSPKSFLTGLLGFLLGHLCDVDHMESRGAWWRTASCSVQRGWVICLELTVLGRDGPSCKRQASGWNPHRLPIPACAGSPRPLGVLVTWVIVPCDVRRDRRSWLWVTRSALWLGEGTGHVGGAR